MVSDVPIYNSIFLSLCFPVSSSSCSDGGGGVLFKRIFPENSLSKLKMISLEFLILFVCTSLLHLLKDQAFYYHYYDKNIPYVRNLFYANYFKKSIHYTGTFL